MHTYIRPDRAAADTALLAGAALALCPPRTGGLTLDVRPECWPLALEWARDGAGCRRLDVLCARPRIVRRPAIEVVAHLAGPHGRIRLRTAVPGDHRDLSTATGLYPTAAGDERAVHAMFGLVFTGHPGIDPLLR